MNMFQVERGAAADLIHRIDECQVRREAPPARSPATKNGF
jgi:hypothetical protein